MKSQWDFGDLFSSESLGSAGSKRKALSVSELTSNIRAILEQHVGQVWVTGEISNLVLQSSGHIYFTLKDAGAQLSCVLFRGEPRANRRLLENGRKVNLHGEVTVYEPRGQYQLRVFIVELEGLGALQVAFERLKEKLKAEGLFAQERKRPLPRFPQRIGLVTSPSGAAMRDVLHAVQRRNPGLEIILAPCRVQGDGAAQEIADAVMLLNRFHGVQVAARGAGAGLDLILATRGGGSLEDLWAFNEEVVARAIFNSALPVVSGVGHEIDFTISDFVADVRAATPTAAAELITENVFASARFVSEATDRIGQLARQQVEDKRSDLEDIAQRLVRMHPRRRLDDQLQYLDDLQSSLSRRARQILQQHQLRARNCGDRLSRLRPGLVIKQRGEAVERLARRLRERVRVRCREERDRVAAAEARLRLLGPEQVLSRGYSITADAASGAVIRDPAAVRPGQRLKTRLRKGSIISVAEGEWKGVG